MTCLSCNDKYYLKVKQDKRGEASNKGCHTDSYFSTPKIKDINWLMKSILFFSITYMQKHMHTHSPASSNVERNQWSSKKKGTC